MIQSQFSSRLKENERNIWITFSFLFVFKIYNLRNLFCHLKLMEEMYSIARPYCSESHNLKSILLFKVKIMVDDMDNIFVHSYKIISTKNYRLSFTSCQILLDK